MPIFDTNVDYTQLIQFTEGSLKLASFVQIRNALIARMQEIYGNDIDVSPASADGQYINSLALIYHNVLQTIQKGFDSLDPAIASGGYLDTICSFNNIQRINKSPSTCQLYIYNSTGTTKRVNYLTFIDKNNKLWIWDNGGKIIEIPPKDEPGNPYLILDVKCEELGEISAPGANAFYHYEGDSLIKSDLDEPSTQDWNDSRLYVNSNINGTIYQCIEENGLWVWQYKDADVGTNEETDEALRSRRYQMMGNTSVSVLEGLKGNLLNIDGIKDVFIFNNISNSSVTLSPGSYAPIGDGNTILPKSVYIVLRYKKGISIDNEVIGKIIYNKMTPGILTNSMDNPTLRNGIQGELEIVRTSSISDMVYWKICKPINPTVEIDFLTNKKIYDYPVDESNKVIADWHFATSETEKRIVKNIQKLVDNSPINVYLSTSEILSSMQKADIQKDGVPTYYAQNGIFEVTAEYEWAANLSYFEYQDQQYLFRYDVDASGNPTGGAELHMAEAHLTLTPNTLSLNVGENSQLVPNLAYKGMIWTSSDESVATVDATGLVTAVGAGTATITAQYEYDSATCSVTVS